MAISATAARTISSFCRALYTISAIVVLGITAWAVQSDKSVTVIYTLVIACLTVFLVFLLLAVAFFSYRKPIYHVIGSVLEFILAFLWIASFVLVVNNFERVSCRVNRWHGMVVCARQHTVEAFAFIAFFFTLVAAIFSFITVYALSEESHGQYMTRKEKPNVSHPEPEANPETHVNNGHVNNGHIDNGNVNDELPPSNVV